MPIYAQHPKSPIKIVLDEIRPWEEYCPPLLQSFLCELNLAKNTNQVWDLYVDLCLKLGQKIVTYAFLRHDGYRNFIPVFRGNLPDHWTTISANDPDFTYNDFTRMHSILKLTSFVNGLEFLDLIENEAFCTPEYIKFLEKAADMGMRSGLFIPFRSATKGERGGSAFGGTMSRADFIDFLQEHGQTIQVAALYVHNTYQMHLRQEYMDQFALTARQIEFLRLSANGLSIQMIAHKWGVSEQAVSKHLRALFKRLGTRSKMGIMAKAMSMDLISEADFTTEEYLTTEWT